MSVRSSYLVTVHTGTSFSPEDYAAAAGTMVNALQDTFTAKMPSLTKRAVMETCHTEAEVAMEETGLVGKCVIDITAEGRVPLDKSNLSRLLKAQLPWAVKIEKRNVTDLES